MPTQLILIVVAMAAIFYLLILRPQQRQKREREQLMRDLDVGVEVLTVGGIYGTVVELRDDEFDLEVDDGVVLKMDRRAIGSVIPDTEAEPDDDDADDGEPVDDDGHEGDPAADGAADADQKS